MLPRYITWLIVTSLTTAVKPLAHKTTNGTPGNTCISRWAGQDRGAIAAIWRTSYTHLRLSAKHRVVGPHIATQI